MSDSQTKHFTHQISFLIFFTSGWTVTYYTQKCFIQWTTSKIWEQKWFRHFDLITRVFSLIANATFLHHRLNEIMHCLVTGWPKLVLSNYVLKLNSGQLSTEFITYLPIKITWHYWDEFVLTQFNSELLSYNHFLNHDITEFNNKMHLTQKCSYFDIVQLLWHNLYC